MSRKVKLSLQYLMNFYGNCLRPYYEVDDDGNVSLCEDYYKIVAENSLLSFSAGFLTRLYKCLGAEVVPELSGVTKNEAFDEGYTFASSCIIKIFKANIFNLNTIHDINLFNRKQFRFFEYEAKRWYQKMNR